MGHFIAEIIGEIFEFLLYLIIPKKIHEEFTKFQIGFVLVLLLILICLLVAVIHGFYH